MRRVPAAIRRPLWAMTLLVLCPVLAAAQPARISITLLSPQGDPVQDASVAVTSPDRGDIDIDKTTNKRGKALLVVPDVTLRYDVRIEAEGFDPVDMEIKPDFGATTFREITLTTTEAFAAPSAAVAGGDVESRRVFTPAEKAFNQGVELLYEGDTDAALAHFLEAREKGSDLASVHDALATIYLEKERYEEALASAQRLVELQPQSPRGLRLLYDAHKGAGNEKEAQAALKDLSALAQDGDSAALLYNEGADALKVGDVDAALQRFQEALEAEPDMVAAMEALMIVQLRREDHAAAAAAAERYLAHAPGDKRALQIRYEAYRQLGETAKAEEAFRALSEADPVAMASAFLQSGIDKFHAGDAAGAIADLERTLELDPEQSIAHYHLGLAHTNQGNTAQAKRHLEAFVAAAPDDANAASARQMLEYLD